jgi:hypothetical protein
MVRVLTALLGLCFVSGAAVPAEDGLASAVAAHDHHPGLGHPEEGEGEHHHGDPDDHHETPDSPCHHHDEHTCCSTGQVLAPPGAPASFETLSAGCPAVPPLEPRDLPSVREIFHVPLA